MKVVKYFLLVLLVLISVATIFNNPGVDLLGIFYRVILQNGLGDFVDWPKVLLQYPPGVFLVLEFLLSQFKLDPDNTVFYRQSVWIVVKFLIYFAYLLTYLSLIYFKKVHKNIVKLSFLDLSISYFASVSILLSSVGLMFFDIMGAPFLILSLSFLLSKRLYSSALFFLLALFFNWTFFVLAPVYLFLFLKNGTSWYNRTLAFGSFFAVPLFIFFSLFVNQLGNLYFVGTNSFLNPASFAKLLNLPFEYVFKIGRMDNFGWLITGLSLLIVIIGLGNLIRKSLTVLPRKISYVFPYSIIPATFSLSFFWTSAISFVLPSLFLIVYFCYILKFKSLSVTPPNMIQGMFIFYLIASLFLQDLNAGSLTVMVLMGLLVYVFNSTKFNFYLLILLNLLAFINIFFNFGITGILPIRGQYFIFFQTVFSAFLALFTIWYLNLFFKQKPIDHKMFYYLKWLIIILMVLLNLSWIPVHGSPDHISWTQYTIASVQQPNPFAAQALVDQRYPPLSTAILSIFANGWKMLIGVSENYTIATKLSVALFYSLTVILLIKFSKAFSGKTKLSVQDKLLVILTTFSLVVQTQGFADLNIHLIPSLFASIFFLFKKKYWLSGILMGLTLSIKWQPVILLPLFLATLFDYKNFFDSLKRISLFAFGFFPIPILVWFLVLISPGGKGAFDRATEYLIQGAPMLSGQALNLNWIVTYMVHIINPFLHGSLQDLDYLNRQIPTSDAPWIFQGALFLTVWFFIVLRYWLKTKKDIVNFLAASLMIFFSHYQLNKSAYEKHIFYVVILMLFLYLIRPTNYNKWLLILFDVMTVMNLIFFYGFTGTGALNRLFFNLDLTVIFSAFYLIIFLYILWSYFKKSKLV